MVIYRRSKYYTEERESDRGGRLSPLLMRALRARGAETPEAIERFLDPSPAGFHDPFLLPDMDKAVERIRLALDTRERICVFGDYDVDGICSTAMLTDYFRSVGADVVYHIPSRSEEGYGMSAAAVERLYEQGVGLIITVDNGISASNEIARCRELGIDVVVTDHHIPPGELPECSAVVCHTVPGSRYPASILCGAGTAFKLLHALAGLDTAMRYISLAGLASVADVVPLLDENRIFVKLGLDALNSGACPLGLTRLIESIPTIKKPYNTCNLGFAIAPRLNASGRMSDASLSVELFLSNDIPRMDAIIAELNRLNELRQQDESRILRDALDMLSGADLSDARAIVLMKRDWNGGVIGIAASRILDMFHRPTILFCESNGALKGSARSIDGVNIHSALSRVSDCFLRFGGHAKAAGITMEESRFEEFKTRLNEALREDHPDEAFAASRDYEFEIPLDMVTGELINEFALLAPFGESNPSPVFRSRSVEIRRLRRCGSDSQHTRMEVASGTGAAQGGASALEAIWFCSAPYFRSLLASDRADILYTPSINRWCGTEGIQLRLKWAESELPADIPAYIDAGMWNFCEAIVENAQLTKPKEDEAFLPRFGGDLKKLFSSRLSGIMALAFSPEAAERALREISETGIAVDVCYGSPTDPTIRDHTLVLAPKLGSLPERGYQKVVLLDMPLFKGTEAFLRNRLPDAELISMAEPYARFPSGFTPACLRFSLEREFMADCYRAAHRQLSEADTSFEELAIRLSERTSTPRFAARFALAVFTELGFFVFNERGSLSLAEAGRAPLTDSRLYSAVVRTREKLIPGR